MAVGSERKSGNPTEEAVEREASSATGAAAVRGVVREGDIGRGEVPGESCIEGHTCVEGETGDAGRSAAGEGIGGAGAVDESADAGVADGRDKRATVRVSLFVERDLLGRRGGNDVRGTMIARGWRPK